MYSKIRNTLAGHTHGLCLRGLAAGAVALSILLTGCELLPPVCVSDADCDDGAFCNGAELCVEGRCVGREAPCGPDDADCDRCDEQDDVCLECCADGECDDGVFCNGVETCGAGHCVAGEALCSEAEICNEAAARCDECAEDSDCDDGLFCTIDVCDAEQCSHAERGCDDGLFCTGTETCDEVANSYSSSGGPCGPCHVCDEQLGMCLAAVPCLVFAYSCDDGVFCNGMESCEGEGCCVTSGPPCGEGEICNDQDDVCLRLCDVEADCIDGERCDELEGLCFRPCDQDADCDDSVYCNGPERCEDPGACRPGSPPCQPDEVCVEGLERCEPVVECTVDAECDDGLFCTGVETCVDGFCVPGDGPCPIVETCVVRYCDEDADECTDTPPPFDPNGPIPNGVLSFTLGTDELTGTGGSDTVHALLLFNAPTGTNLPSFQTGDSLDGRDCPGVLTVQTNFDEPMTVEATLISVERFVVTDFGTAATTISAADFMGLETIAAINSTNPNPVLFSALGNLVDAEMTNTAAGLALSFAAGVTDSASDSLTLTLSETTGGLFSAETAGANGIEVLNVVSTGGANTLARVTQLNGTTLGRINVSGAHALTITMPLDDSVTTVDASGLGSGLSVAAGAGPVVMTGGSGADTLVGSPGEDTINGGSGGDVIDAAAGADTVTGGAGADVFRQGGAAANGADRQTIIDFDDTPATGDRFNLSSGLAVLGGTDDFAGASSIQTHSMPGDLVVSTAAEVVVVRSGTVASFASADALSGTDLLTAIGGSVTVPSAGEQRLFAVADLSGSVGIYLGDAGSDSDIGAAEITLVAALQGPAVDIAGLTSQSFSNDE